MGGGYTNWRPGGSGDWLLIYTRGGSGRFVAKDGAEFATQEGDAVLYAPGNWQDYSTAPAPGNWHLLWIHFTPKPHWQIWLRWAVMENGFRALRLEEGEIREEFVAAIERANRLLRRGFPGAPDLAGNALESALLWANVAANGKEWLAIDLRVRKAVDYLIGHLNQPFSLKELARCCGTSVSRLAFWFKKETGVTPQKFLERHRMQHACQLLHRTDLSIAGIASEVGYGDPFYFSNRFRGFTGASPSGYRQAARHGGRLPHSGA